MIKKEYKNYQANLQSRDLSYKINWWFMMLLHRYGDKTGEILHMLSIVVNFIHQVLCQCSGTTSIFTATDKYQQFTSFNYPIGYSNNQQCEWRIEAGNITDAIRMEIIDAEIEYHASCVYDHGEVFDGYNVSADSLGKFCGRDKPSFVSTGNYMAVTFKSDYSLPSKGFKARYKSGPRSSLLDKEDDEQQVNMLAIIGASVGCVVFIIVIMTMVYTYIQARKAKEMRRNPHLRRGMARVEPFVYGGGWSYLDGPAPPAYGEIYSSPMSPPPIYSEIDPNPNPSERLPGRREYMADNQLGENEQTEGQQRERTDTNANTHFILSNNTRSIQTTSHSAGRRSTSSSHSGTVTGSLQTLNPAFLNTAGTDSGTNENHVGMNLPGQTDCLPSAVASISTTSSQRVEVRNDTCQNNTMSQSLSQTTPAGLSATTRERTLTSPCQMADESVILRHSEQEIDDNISLVSEMSLPPLPEQ